MSLIKVPFLAKSEQGLPLQRALDFAASKIGVSPYTMAMAATYFFEQLADEVARGRVVRVPGFGVFAPCLDERPQYLARRGGPRCVPRFSPARGFRMEVMLSAPPSRAGKTALKAHSSNHRVSDQRYTSARVFTAMHAIRDQISAQLGRCLDTGDSEPKRSYARRVPCAEGQ